MSLDFRDFHEKGKKPLNKRVSENMRWWEMKGKDCAHAIDRTLETISKNQAERIRQQLICSRLYGNLSTMGPNGLTFSKLTAVHPTLREHISYNVVQSAIDTIVSRITKNRPRPFFVTSGGDHKTQKKAKDLNKFIDGMFYEQKAYEHGTIGMRDGCIWGDGLTKVLEKDGRVAYERALSQELWTDELEGFYGFPASLYHCRYVDRDKVLAEWGDEFQHEIEDAQPAKPDPAGTFGTVSDLVQLNSCWHLPSKPGAKDGRYVISLDEVVLYEEPYEWMFYPFARFQWTPAQFGYWGKGLAESIQNIQIEITKLLTLIQRSFHLGGSFKVLLENGSKVVSDHLNNDVGAIIQYNGTKPEYVIPPLVPPEIYAHLRTLKEAAYEQAGISQLSAVSKLPEGLESGKAMRTYNDIESERFMTIGRQYERYYLDLARLSIEVAKKIAKRHKGHYKVSVPGKRFFDTVDWADIDLTEDSFMMQVFPISSLPNDPAGRLQTIQDYIGAGFLTPREGKQLLDFPDLERVEGLNSAYEEYLQKKLDKMIEDGEMFVPEPYDDLKLAHELAIEYYQRGKLQDLEEEKLNLLRIFISQIEALVKMLTQPPMGAPVPGQLPPGAPGPAAPGPGMGPPVSPPMPVPPSGLVPPSPQPPGATG
jgi:hypothetical protein